MNREEHLCYCKVCDHRKMDFKRGIVCGLTNEYANFDPTCDQFSGSESERLDLTNEQNQKAQEQKAALELLDKETSPGRIIISILITILILGFTVFRCSRM